jgi:hypothetical protein
MNNPLPGPQTGIEPSGQRSIWIERTLQIKNLLETQILCFVEEVIFFIGSQTFIFCW